MPGLVSYPWSAHSSLPAEKPSLLPNAELIGFPYQAVPYLPFEITRSKLTAAVGGRGSYVKPITPDLYFHALYRLPAQFGVLNAYRA